jgi:sigma-70-like protein
MTELQSLSSDQQTVLSGIVEAGKSYAELARELGVSKTEVRERARAALDALAEAAPPAEELADPSLAPASVLEPDKSSGSMKAGIITGLVLGSIAAAIILITNQGGGSSTPSSLRDSPRRTPASSSAGGLTLLKTIPLASVGKAPKTTGKAYVIAQGAQRRIFITVQGLSRGSRYQLWLYNSASSYTRVGQTMTVATNGALQGSSNLPSSTVAYQRIILTREGATHPRQPGQVALSGQFSVR